MKILQGILHEVSHPEGFWFETSGGDMFPVKGEGLPTETPIDINIQDGEITGWSYGSVIASRSADKEDVALAYCGNNVPYEKAYRLQNQFRRISFGKKEFKFTPYSVGDIAITTVTGGPWSDVIAEVERQSPGNTHNAYHALSPYITAFCGNAFLGGSRACSSVVCPDETQSHEEGHRGLNLHHSGGPGGEYADKAGSYMGNRSGRNNWLAAHMYKAGFIDEHEVIHLEDKVRAFLVDPESQPLSLRPGEHKAVFVEKGGKHYCVSYHHSNHNEGRVYVHRRQPATAHNWHRTYWLATLRADDTYTVDGISVRCVNIGDSAEVVVKMDEAMEEPAPQPAPQWVVPDETFPIREAYGAWRNPDWTYQGILVHQIRDEVAATWYTWDRHNNLRWFLMQGPIEGESANLTIYATNGQRQMWVDGHAILYFYNNGNGVFKAQSKIMGRTGMSLHRLTPDNSKPLNGLYSAGNREGLSIFQDNDDKVFLWMFTYTQGMGQIKPPKQRWLHAEGDPHNLVVFEPKNGYPEVEAEQATLEPIGTGRLQGGKFILNQKEYPLDRLA